MATRAIVTSQPDVACDVCGRRLLRGEHPDTFLAGDGERRTVCELCAPRAAHEGWRRESDGQDLALRPARRRRGVSLLGRLRQLGDPSPTRTVAKPREAADSDEEWEGFDDHDPAGHWQPQPRGLQSSAPVPAVAVAAGPTGGPPPGSAGDLGSASDADPAFGAQPPAAGAVPTLDQAVDVFNASEHPRRMAGVARSLGEPSVTVRAPEAPGSRVTIVVAWEICWYRYEVDLEDPSGEARMVEKGMELGELPAEDLHANATADERGELALLGS